MSKIRLEEFRVSRFMGIKEGHIKELKDINVFVGKNGSGKSTLLEALFLLAGSLDPRPKGPQAGMWAGFKNGGRVEWLLARRNLAATGWLGEKGIRDLSLRLPTLPREMWFGNDTSQNIQLSCRMTGHAAPFPVDFLSNQSSNIGRYYDSWTRFVQNTSAPQANVLCNSMFVDGRMLFEKKLEEVYWDSLLLGNGKTQLLEAYNRTYSPQLESVDYSPTNKRLVVGLKGERHGLPLDNLGSGMRMGLRLLMLGCVMKDTLLLVEEFDAYQHPESLAVLLPALREVCASNNVQLLMTTHRTETLRMLLESDGRSTELEGTVHALSLEPDGMLQCRSIAFEEARSIFESGYDFRKLHQYL